MKINSVSNLSVLCARMNQLNNSKAQENSANNTELMSKELALAFKARVSTGYRRAVIENKETKAVYDKITQVLKRLPDNAKMTKPILINVGEENYGFIWDKSSANKNILTIRNNIQTAEDWEKADSTRSVMSCVFNKEGVLQIGELIKPIKSDYSQGVFYYHDGKSNRRIRLDELTLKPTTVSPDVWTIIPNLSTRNTYGDIDLSVKLKDVMLSDMFLEFTKKKTSILI